MKKEAFITRYHAEMTDVRVSPQLKRKTLDALNGKENVVMKKKLSAVIVLMIAVLLIGAAAIAAVSRAGILDFVGLYANSCVPEDAQSYVQTDVKTVENELVTVNLRELFYDGYVARMTLDVIPKDSRTMLLGADMSPEDNWQNMTVRSGAWNENDLRTALDVYRENNYQSVYAVSCRLFSDTAADRSFDYVLSEDNVLTLYQQTTFESSKAKRSATLEVYLTPCGYPYNDQRYQWPDDRITLEIPTLLEQVDYSYETYVCTEAKEFPSVGVRVDELRMKAGPQDIHTEILYTVIDREAYNTTDNSLWFEFINPESTAEAPAAQRLQDGLYGYGTVSPLDGDDMLNAVRFRQIESLARSELHDVYTLRAFSSWDKQRFETHTFTMRKAEQAE